MCPTGRLEGTVVSKRFRGHLVTNLLADRCDRCGELVFSMDELDRVKLVLARKEQLRSKAA
jgi:hypothetical protein